MNATSLYVSTCRLVLQAQANDPSTWHDLYKLFPCLRQSLSCYVCGHLLIEPYTPTESNCQHHVCRSCKGGKKKLRSTCSWCKDYSKYVENVQLRTLLQCYKKLCQYITSSQIYRNLCSLPSSSTNNNNGSNDNKTLLDIIKEGTGFKDDFKLNSSLLNVSMISNSVKSTSTQTFNLDKTQENNRNRNNVPVENGRSTYSVTNNGNRLTFKRTAKEINDINLRNGDAEKGTKVNKVRKRSVYNKLPTCRCGQNTPAKGTCRGYRCPCYSGDKPCTEDCNCVACKNPRGTPPPKPDNSSDDQVESTTETTQVSASA